MKSLKHTDTEATQSPIFDPFPEPRTMPEGWDLSALLPGERLQFSYGSVATEKTNAVT